MKKCPNCNFENQDNSQFCQNCGAPLPMTVPQGKPQQPKNDSSGMCTASMVLGIVGFVLTFVVIGIVPAIIGLVLGIIALVGKKPKRGQAIAGVVLSGIAIILFVLLMGSTSAPTPDSQLEDSETPKYDNTWATEQTGIEEFDYYIDGDDLFIQEYNGNDDKVYIDSKYEIDGKELSVSALQDGTFLFSDVESVILADGISSLDDNTFNSCDVKHLYIPSTLEPKDSSFWSYLHDVEEIYYGGSNEQWNKICAVPREELDVKQIYCNVSIDDLGTDEAKSETVKMSSNDENGDSAPEKIEQKEQSSEDKFVSDSSEYISEDISRKLYGIIVNDIGFSDVKFKGKNEMGDSVWDISCDGISILAVASDDVYRIWNSDCTFYEEGTVVTTKQQMESTVISSDERSKFYFMAQEIVTQCLKNPSSADFPSIAFSPHDILMEKKDDIVAVQSYVDATNSYGGQVRSQWTVEFRVTDLDNLFYEVLYVNIDGQTSGTYVELD